MVSNDRLRIPQDPDYFHAIGLAAVAFARLEWDAVWCCERLASGYVRIIQRRKKTAGAIARDLEQLFSRIADSNLQAKVIPFGAEFSSVVQERNALLHGKPGTASGGEQRLFGRGVAWTLDNVHEFSDRCVRAAIPLNALLYDEFKDPCTIALHPS